VEPLIHFVVPFTAMMLVGVKTKKALPISLLVLLPDLDALFLVHRSLSHSLIVVLVVAMSLLLLTYKLRLGVYGYVGLGLLAVASHLVLDLFSGYTPLLWPLYDHSLWVQAGLVAHIGSSPSLTLSLKLLVKPIAFHPFPSLDAPLFTGEGLILSAILLMPVLLKALRRVAER